MDGVKDTTCRHRLHHRGSDGGSKPPSFIAMVAVVTSGPVQDQGEHVVAKYFHSGFVVVITSRGCIKLGGSFVHRLNLRARRKPDVIREPISAATLRSNATMLSHVPVAIVSIGVLKKGPSEARDFI